MALSNSTLLIQHCRKDRGIQAERKMIASDFNPAMFQDLVTELTQGNAQGFAINPPVNNWNHARKNHLRQGSVVYCAYFTVCSFAIG